MIDTNKFLYSLKSSWVKRLLETTNDGLWKVFYNKKSKKMIYGTTSSEERKELEEEGIDLLSIPWVSKDN